jgi:hypothetical protein
VLPEIVQFVIVASVPSPKIPPPLREEKPFVIVKPLSTQLLVSLPPKVTTVPRSLPSIIVNATILGSFGSVDRKIIFFPPKFIFS